MKPVERSEILPLGDYEAIRDRFRSRIIGEKKHRRVPVGDDITVVFENHDTVLLQIQEMLRTERITKESAIAHEIETYNSLVPGHHQLSMTLFIEINDKEQREKALTERAGMEKHVGLEIDGERFAAVASAREGADPSRTTAVQYYLIDLSPDKAKALVNGKVGEVAIVIDHPACNRRSVLSDQTVSQLAGDLSWD
ncbi:MAG TPA: DUF3501 family protein [Polyangiaceae bacterium]|nr:DUF3501 family protein [Polyangiaceae bacterium]